MNRELSASSESLLNSRSRSLFANLDQDGKGFIERTELADYCGVDIGQDEFTRLFRELDKDGDGRISLDDFREGFRVISRTVHRQDERRRSSVASSLSIRLQLSHSGSHANSLNDLDEEPDSTTASASAEKKPPHQEEQQEQLALSLSDCLQSLTCQDYVLDLYQQLSDQQQQRPQLLECFETVLAELIQSIRTLQSEQASLEESMRQERDRHLRDVREMEAEVERQVAAAEGAALARAREAADRDCRAALEAKDAELLALLQQLTEHRSRLASADELGAEVARLRRELDESRVERKLAQSELSESETRLAVAMSDISSLKQALQEREFSVARERETVQEQLRQQARIAQQLQAMHAVNRDLRDRNEELMQVAMETASSSSLAAPPLIASGHRRLGGACSFDDDDDGVDAADDTEEETVAMVAAARNVDESDEAWGEADHQARWDAISPSGSGGARNRRRPQQPQNRGNPERMFKVVLAGDSSVGKSCFIMRLCDNKFVEKTTATLGVDFKTKVLCVDGRLLAVQLWDTAGQERFRSIAKSYFRRADGVLLLYDCTHERSFLSVRDWVSQVREVADVPIMICGNKIDLRPAETLADPADGPHSRRTVGYAEALQLAREHDALFAETSAKSGENVELSVAELARRMRVNEDLQVSQAHLRSPATQQAAAGASVKLTTGGGGGGRHSCCETS